MNFIHEIIDLTEDDSRSKTPIDLSQDIVVQNQGDVMDLTRLTDSEIANVTENLFNSDSDEDEDPDLTEDEEEPIPAEKPPASPVKEGPHVPPPLRIEQLLDDSDSDEKVDIDLTEDEDPDLTEDEDPDLTEDEEEP